MEEGDGGGGGAGGGGGGGGGGTGGGLPVVLGFAEEPEGGPEGLAPGRFPSKVGGEPAWLDPAGLPGGVEACECAACGEPGLRFLLQLYCPLDSCGAQCFHRAIFIFVCPRCLARPARPEAVDGAGGASVGTYARGVRVFRSQLPRTNPHYPPDPLPPLEDFASTHAPGPARGSWPELELVNEEEPDEEEAQRAPGEARVQAMVKEHQRQEAEGAGEDSGDEGGMDVDSGDEGGSLPPDPDEEEETEAEREQECWDSFRYRVARAPDQVVRYDHNGSEGPLWSSLEGRPSSIPLCGRCGAPRDFELQVMPQCLLHLGQDELATDSLDWDSIVVFTCRNSCGPAEGGGYVEEFGWVHRSTAGGVRTSAEE